MPNSPSSSSPSAIRIAHADMDAFYAAVEQLDHPELRGRPVLVGPPSGRGVVLTASYEARPFKVGSAMPMVEALRRCPEAVVVPPRFDRYMEISELVMETFRDFSPAVEPLSMDEAFIDLTGTEHLFGNAAQSARKIMAAVAEATGGLPVSVGVAATKYVAKVASGEAKPHGLMVVPANRTREWLAPLPVAKLWGAGPKTQALLHEQGFHRIGDIAEVDIATLRQCCGSLGERFHALARGEDPRPVSGCRDARSMSCDRTLNNDISDPQAIRQHLQQAADHLGSRLRKRGMSARGVRLKLKTNQFATLSRQCTLSQPTNVAAHLFAAARTLLERCDHPGPFRLVGLAAVGIGAASEPEQLGLWQAHRREARLERTIDALNDRFGRGTLRRARDLSREQVLTATPNLDFALAN